MNQHLFRHEYGPLVALLTRRLGVEHLAAVEDAVQDALLKALEHWPHSGEPEVPSAWLYRVAERRLVSEFRAQRRRQQLLEALGAGEASEVLPDVEAFADPPIGFGGELTDAFLKMLFASCHPDLPVHSQLVFTLKSLCGFSIAEIAARLFMSEANAYKRFSRARQQLRLDADLSGQLNDAETERRLEQVHKVIYLMFTEGYLSSHPDLAIRKDLCDGAIRLGHLLVESRAGQHPESRALLALMYLHRARLTTRQDHDGALVLLEHQQRNDWDWGLIVTGLALLNQAAEGEQLSRFHIEAGIAAEHCMASSFEQTRWERIASSYELLERLAPSPMYRLGRALALAEHQDAEAGLAVLSTMVLPGWFECSYYWYAVKADLCFRSGHMDDGNGSAGKALAAAPNQHIRSALRRRFRRYQDFTDT